MEGAVREANQTRKRRRRNWGDTRGVRRGKSRRCQDKEKSSSSSRKRSRKSSKCREGALVLRSNCREWASVRVRGAMR